MRHLGSSTFAAMTLLVIGCGGNDHNTGGAGSTSDAVTTVTATTVGSGGAGGGGGNGPVSHEVFGSGSRLRAVYQDAGGEAESFLAFQDTLLGVRCRFTTLDDGSIRCVPSGASASAPASAIYFSDAACTTQVGTWSTSNDCDSAPSVVLEETLSSTPTCAAADSTTVSLDFDRKSTVLTLGPPITTTVYKYGSATGCVPSAADPTHQYYKIGAQVSYDTYVKGTSTTKLVGPRAQITFIQGEDGSFVYTGVSDSQLQFRCKLTDHCLPPFEADFRSSYSDSTCTQFAGVEQNGEPTVAAGCPAPMIVHRQDPSAQACGGLVDTYFEVGSVLDPSAAFAKAGSCIPYKNFDNTPYTFVNAGSPVDLSTYISVADTATGTGRIKAIQKGLPSGELLTATTGFQDGQQGDAACSVVAFKNGKSYCVPLALLIQPTLQYFQDAACTLPLNLSEKGQCPPETQQPSYVVVQTADQVCELDGSHSATIQEVDPTVTYTGQVYTKGSGPNPTCIELSNTSNYFLYTNGPAADPGTVFQEVKITTD